MPDLFPHRDYNNLGLVLANSINYKMITPDLLPYFMGFYNFVEEVLGISVDFKRLDQIVDNLLRNQEEAPELRDYYTNIPPVRMRKRDVDYHIAIVIYSIAHINKAYPYIIDLVAKERLPVLISEVVDRLIRYCIDTEKEMPNVENTKDLYRWAKTYMGKMYNIPV